MQGSLYPNGVLVDQSALRRTELTKAEEILRTRIHLSSRGVSSGGDVTVNGSTAYRVDVGVFSGYTPRGDFIESSTIQYAVNLSDYTLGTVNLICAVYYETNSKSQPHETNGQAYPTHAAGAFRIRAFTEAEFAALEDSDDNLSNDAVDRCLILAKVVAEGSFASITSITRSNEFDNILYTSPSELAAISGVTILSIDPDTPTGSASLTFDDTSAPSTYKFKWTSPGGIISAAYVNVTTDSIVTITDGSGYWVKIQVILSQLPVGLSVPYAETFTVNNLYEQEIPSNTGEDWLHRNFIGTGVVSLVNPHGQSLDDLAGSSLTLLDEHQDVMHCNGIWRNSYAGVFLGSISTASPSGDTLFIQQPTTADLYYVNGKRLQTANPGSVIFNAANFASNYLGTNIKEGMKLYEVYVDDEETIIPHLRAKGPESTTRNATGVFLVNMSNGHPAGTFDLQYEVKAASIEYRWDSGPVVSRAKPGDFDQIIRLYRPNGVDWVEILYADDSSAGDEWLKTATATYVDSVTVYAEKDRDQNLQIMSVPYWYNASSSKGQIGAPPYGLSRTTIDNRIFGNLCKSEVADLNLKETVYDPQDEMHFSGCLINRHSGSEFTMTVPVTPGLSVDVVGGYYYCRGQRLSYSGGSVTVLDNVTSLIYADLDGNAQALNVTAGFSGSVSKALEYLLGSTFDRNSEFSTGFIDSNHRAPELGVPLWVVVSSSGSIDTDASYNICRNINGPVEPWSVGSFAGGSSSAFDSLAAAFAHASSFMSLGLLDGVEVKIVGDNSIDFAITQPASVSVVGTKSGGVVTDSTSGVSTGVWILSSGCSVEGVSLVGSTAGGSFFHLEDDVKLSNCTLSATLISYYFAYAGSSNSYDNVVISDNKFYSRGALLRSCTNASNSGWRIEGNYIDQTEHDLVLSTSGLIYLSGNFHNISSNTINITNSGGNVSHGIYASNCNNSCISSNIVVLDSVSQDNVSGIYLSGCDYVSVECNSISYSSIYAGPYSDVVYGIYVTNCDGISFSGGSINFDTEDPASIAMKVALRDSSITGMCIYNYGISLDLSSSIDVSVSGCSITSNMFGVKGYLGSNISISGCSISVTSKEDSGISDTGALDLGSIGIGFDSTDGINVKDCNILVRRESTSILRRSCNLYTTGGSFTISGNTFNQEYSSLSSDGISDAAYFVYIDGPEGSCAFSGNHINEKWEDVPFPSYSHGAYFSTNLSTATTLFVSGNTIYGSHCTISSGITTPQTTQINGGGTATLIYDLFVATSGTYNSDRIIASSNHVFVDIASATSAYSPVNNYVYFPLISESSGGLSSPSTVLNTQDQYLWQTGPLITYSVSTW